MSSHHLRGHKYLVWEVSEGQMNDSQGSSPIGDRNVRTYDSIKNFDVKKKYPRT
jgi:hypothetical protein